MTPPKTVILPSTAHRLPESMGQSLIDRLRCEHKVNAWAFLMPDHLLSELYNGFVNNPEIARKDLVKQLPDDVREALFPTHTPVKRIEKVLRDEPKGLPHLPKEADDDDGGGMGGLHLEISPADIPEELPRLKKALEKRAQAARPHIPLKFPAQHFYPRQREGPRQGGGISL